MFYVYHYVTDKIQLRFYHIYGYDINYLKLGTLKYLLLISRSNFRVLALIGPDCSVFSNNFTL